MKERLEKILEKFNISASKLAEMMDIQRSGISHILAGRNKPSFDFMVRLTEVFPDIDANWLLTGQGSMLRDESESNLNATGSDRPGDSGGETSVYTGTSGKPYPNLNSPRESESPVPDEDSAVYKSKHADNSQIIDGVVVLYSNGTFRRYRPE